MTPWPPGQWILSGSRTGTESKQSFLDSLAQKIVVASCAKVRRRAAVSPAAPSLSSVSPAGVGGRSDLDRTIIGLGASTGGTEATLEVLKRLPADIPGMVIVQHMPVGFTKMYAERLNRLCRMEVREAVNGDEIRRGLALIAPADLQARVVRMGSRYTLSCLPGEKVSGHRPSVDALFSSMASAVKCPMVGIIMTGMGRDGADGLLQMRRPAPIPLVRTRTPAWSTECPWSPMISVRWLSRPPARTLPAF